MIFHRKASGLIVLLLMVLVMMAAPSANAETESLQRVVAALERAFKPAGKGLPAISAFRANFVQESEIASLGQRQEARGQTMFKFLPASETKLVSPLFNWEYTVPHQQRIVSDGRTVWLHIPENRQAIRSESREALTEKGDNPLLFLTHIGTLEQVFTIGWADVRKDQDGDYRLLLLPKYQTALMASLVVVVPRSAVASATPVFPLKTILLTNVNGDRNFIHFYNPVINGGVKAADFRFKPPAGTEILTPEQFQTNF